MFKENIKLRLTATFLICFLFFLQLNAQRWDVPADKKSKNSYIKFDGNTAKEGEAIFTKNCKSCHGDLGKSNGIKTMNPAPPDLSQALTQELTDGELFYILNTGRNAMPSFKNTLSEEERWKAISFIRSFNNKYVQVLSKTDPTKSKLVKINCVFDSLSNKLKLNIIANEKTGVIPLKDAEVSLFVTRYFGKLQIEKTIRTNADGIAIFNFPKDLPGDKTGNVDVAIKVSDELYGEIESVNKFNIGIPTDKLGLTQNRAIWNILKKAPWWIIITYTSIVLTVGAFLLYIIFSLLKIRKLGEN
ncbi:MAG: c-type cytochrome [Bacteroidetes bacterium]|nr:c-type cytochrome [Bacteroidota bacterium]